MQAVKNDDSTAYDLIICLLQDFKVCVDFFCEDFMVYLRVNYLIRNLCSGLMMCLGINIKNYESNSKVYYYKVLDWYEREVWDLYGIIFNNHPNLTRILTDFGFVGFPFRKEFPLAGFFELYYNAEFSLIEQRNLFLKQDYNFFNTENSWFF